MSTICTDCSTTGLTATVPACTDFHLYGLTCCVKEVCRTCQYRCLTCESLNWVNSQEAVDFYYEGYTCYSCKTVNRVKIQYNGDPQQANERYNGQFSEPIMTGRPDTARQYQILTENYTDAAHTWLKTHFADVCTGTDVKIHALLDGFYRKEGIPLDYEPQPLNIIYDAYTELYLAGHEADPWHAD